MVLNMTIEKMRMLRWICVNTMTNHMPNVSVPLGVKFSKKIREGRLRWYEYVRRKCISASVRRVEHISVLGKRKRNRALQTWADQLSLVMGP